MGKGLKRSNSEYRPPNDDEPDFGDPPRHWGRVAGMAGVWAVVLLGAAWMAPGFASGGSDEDADARDQDPTTPRQAAARYLEAGLSDDSDRAGEVLCDDAAPEVDETGLAALLAEYDELLGTYPEIEVSTGEPAETDSGMEIGAEVSFIGERIYYEKFTVTVLATGDSYCVAEATLLQSEDEDSLEEVDPEEQAARYLSAVFVIRDLPAANEDLCDEYEGPKPEELNQALMEWESLYGEATAVQSFSGDPSSSATSTIVYMNVELSSTRASESFSFDVVVEGDCVAAVSGGEALLEPSDE